MNFDLSDDQKLLVETAASFAKKESPIDRMRRLRDDPIGYEPAMWRHMGELGWLGIPFPDSVGGYGGRFIDAALLIEQLGATLVPEPYIPSVILAGMAIERAGDDQQKKRWLVPMIEGKTAMALAYAERHSRYDVLDVATRAERKGATWSISGEKVFVLGGHHADHLGVSAGVAEAGPGGIGLFVVARDTAGLTVDPIATMDGRRAAMIRLDGATVGEDCALGEPGAAGPALEDVMDLASAAACAEGLGIARTVLAMTVEYLKTREQFGAKIGSFQALQHRAVDMFIEVELCHSTVIYAGLAIDDPDRDERQAAVSAAKVQLCQGGRFVVRQGIQLHGGIGCTDEHDVGLYFKRMQVLGALFGDEVYHTERFSRLSSFTADIADASKAAEQAANSQRVSAAGE